jgi:uncharacterized protein
VTGDAPSVGVAARAVAALPARPQADGPLDVAATRPPGWVPPCILGEGEAALTICGNTALMGLHAKEETLFRGVFAGAARQNLDVMLAERTIWLRDRDACGDDRACLTRSYQTRIAILRDTQGLGFPTPLHRAQWELNRIGCDAGPVDGRPGGQTRAALRALAENAMVPIPEDRLGTPETLANLAQVDEGACSLLTQAAQRPQVLIGLWRVTATCPAGAVVRPGTLTYRISITRMSEAETMPEGRAVRGDLSGRVRSYVSPGGGWALTLWWGNAVPTNMTLLPGDAPERLRGTDSNGCTLIAERG